MLPIILSTWDKEAESKALNEAQANIEEQEKLGAIKIANQIKERETKVAETRKDQISPLLKRRSCRKSLWLMRIRIESHR